ncbi:MAG: hypothetical protein ACTSR1_01040 [Candidatus Heimdallarchaeota archaeon]
MSHKGKMQRGKKWWDHRDINGNLPADIAEDPGKMYDVEYFLENSKEKEEVKKKKGGK